MRVVCGNKHRKGVGRLFWCAKETSHQRVVGLASAHVRTTRSERYFGGGFSSAHECTKRVICRTVIWELVSRVRTDVPCG